MVRLLGGVRDVRAHYYLDVLFMLQVCAGIECAAVDTLQ